MPINLSVPSATELKPRIIVFGVGGAGGNAVNNMIEAELEGVDFVIANTDAQAIQNSRAERRIQLGAAITEGLGAGSQPDVGRGAAEESIDEINEHLAGAHMAFITAGMGGGTGTGAAPVIAKAARERGVLTVGVVTKPFQFEGARRMRIAEAGIRDLQQYVDTLIIIPNQNLFRIANEKTTFAQAFGLADEVLHSGVRGVTDLMVMPGLINLDFADVKAIMREMGKAMMGTGAAEGDKRAIEAAEAAISNPLLDETSMKGARGVLINITGGMDMTLFEVDEAANRIRSEVDADANIIVGSTFNEALEGRLRVSVVATGIDAATDEALAPDEEAHVAPTVKPAAWRRPAQPAQPAQPADARPAAPAVAPTAQTAPAAQAAAPLSGGAGAEPNPVRAVQENLRREISQKPLEAAPSEISTQPPVIQPAPSAATPEPEAPRPATARSEAPLAAEPARKAAPAQQKKPGFGLGILNRLKNGVVEHNSSPDPRAPRRGPELRVAARTDNVAGERDRDLFENEDEQLQIPAFLRRQAN